MLWPSLGSLWARVGHVGHEYGSCSGHQEQGFAGTIFLNCNEEALLKAFAPLTIVLHSLEAAISHRSSIGYMFSEDSAWNPLGEITAEPDTAWDSISTGHVLGSIAPIADDFEGKIGIWAGNGVEGLLDPAGEDDEETFGTHCTED